MIDGHIGYDDVEVDYFGNGKGINPPIQKKVE